jgi:hypothetical protein
MVRYLQLLCLAVATFYASSQDTDHLFESDTDADVIRFPHEARRQARIKLLQQAGVQTDMPAKRKALASSMVEKISTKTSGSTFTDEDGIQFEVVTQHPHFIRRQGRIKQLQQLKKQEALDRYPGLDLLLRFALPRTSGLALALGITGA